MPAKTLHTILNYCIALVWLINGFFCKVLNLVPRHQQIVASILGNQYAALLTAAIGVAEAFMAIWIVSRIWPRLNAVVQIIVVAAMNIIECLLVPQLLLWGRVNAIFALAFILIIFYNQFYLTKKIAAQV